MSNSKTTGIAEHESPFNFEDTVEHLGRVLAARGMTVFAKIDYAAGAREAALAMSPATVPIYGNPKGKPIMITIPLAELDLPLRVLVAWLPQERVLFTGDLVSNGPLNIVRDAEMAPWIDTIAALQALNPLVVCPGHGARGDAALLADLSVLSLRAQIERSYEQMRT